MNRFGNGEEPEVFHGEEAAQELTDDEVIGYVYCNDLTWLEEAMLNGFDNDDGAT